MHASLASIGRACTVEDEEPPETPTHSSIDSQTDYLEQCLRPIGWTARELVEKTIELLASLVHVWPYCDQTSRQYAESNCETEYGTVEAEQRRTTASHSITAPATTNAIVTNASISTKCKRGVAVPPVAEVHLDRLSRLHRLCELVRCTLRLDCMTGTYSELNSGLANLYTHSDNITHKEYELLEATLSDYSPAYSSPFPTQMGHSTRPDHHVMMMKHSGLSGTTGLRSSSPSSSGLALSASVYPYSHFCTPVVTNPSQLGELRVICESLRQCLTQLKRFFHEQQSTTRLLRHFPRETKSSLFHSPTQTVTVVTNRLTSATLLSAHHLVYSGLSLLAHADITRYTHGELWEMTRGIEELDILNRQLQIACRTAHSESLCKMLMETRILQKSTESVLGEITHFELLYDPVLVACSISVGYLFTLIAYQRSIRLANAIYQQLSAVRSFDRQDAKGSPGSSTASVAQSKCLTLVEAFRVYLNQNYDRTASEYLRNEYEFIAGFLDVLSQSTNLLYQVQKLKLICSAAAAAQAKKTELDRQHQRCRFAKPVAAHESSSHAVSVEGVHGILVKRVSTEKEPGSSGEGECTPVTKNDCAYNRTSRCVRKGSGSKKHTVSQYQETLHRAGTLDRYVATGSVNYPMSSNETLTNEDSKDVPKSGDACTSVLTEEPKTTTSTGTKKVVQWSDHREISTRHHVIGRFLEMTWRYTEIHLTSLFMCPPTLYVASEQASSFGGAFVRRPTGSDANVSGIGRRCTTISCLLMKPDHIRTLSGYIRELAKPDLFPVGLIPALRRQALRLEELAHRRCWFTSVRSNKIPIRESIQFPLVSFEHLSDDEATPGTYEDVDETHSVFSPDSEVHSPSKNNQSTARSIRISDDSSSEHRLQENCVMIYLRKIKNELDNMQPAVCPTCLFPHLICSSVLSGEFITILRLNVEILNHFSKDRNTVDRLVQSINEQLRKIDFYTPYKPTATFSAEQANQIDALLQSAYDLSRRMNSSVHRFYLYNKSLIEQLVLRMTCALNCTCSTFRIAQLFRIRELIEIFRYLAEVTMNAVFTDYWHPHQDSLHKLITENCSASASANPTQPCSELPTLKIRLPNGIRLARILGILIRQHYSLQQTYTAISDSIRICTLNYVAHFRQTLVGNTSSDDFEEGNSFFWRTPNFMDKFIHSLVTAIPPCSLATVPPDVPCSGEEQPATRASESTFTFCKFHQAVYEQIISKLFSHFCSEWLDQATESVDLQSTEHVSIEKLRSLLMEYRHGSSVELLAVICDCPEFQQLLSTTSARSGCKAVKTAEQELGASSHPMKAEMPSTSQSFQGTDVCVSPKCAKLSSSTTGISRHFPAVITPRSMKDRFASRLNAPGEALAALAEGVKNSIFIPIKQLTTPDSTNCNPPGTAIKPNATAEVVSSDTKSPSTGSET
ncbi:hypothetical protein FGIG_03383 [Fasciola gigantica]|uniref:Uncharacterized protein n=1 Tax=Fasciola gigantica TaxID=46835 RepID=A0A504YZH5_FASGI|nr:hypothetical protein FGIG_03383 [Fasciola gigantica]